MIRVLAICLMLTICAPPAYAEEVVPALSQNRVSITANFGGSEIFVFGGVKRTTPIDEDAPPLEVVITVSGPTVPVIVRRKARTLGIWTNRDSVQIDEAPSFYAIATTRPLTEIMSETERLRHRIGFDRAIRTLGARAEVEDVENFSDAIVRIRKNRGLYAELEETIDLREETLFSTEVALPANLVEGDYIARMYLLRDRDVLHVAERTIWVRKEGLERLIYNTAHEQPVLYGFLAIAVALVAGWVASEAFRILRR